MPLAHVRTADVRGFSCASGALRRTRVRRGPRAVAPGTFGTLVALPIAWALRTYGGDAGWLAHDRRVAVRGIWAAQVTGRDLGVADHGASSATRSPRSCSCSSSPAAMRCATRSRSSCSGSSTSSKPPPIRQSTRAEERRRRDGRRLPRRRLHAARARGLAAARRRVTTQ